MGMVTVMDEGAEWSCKKGERLSPGDGRVGWRREERQGDGPGAGSERLALSIQAFGSWRRPLSYMETLFTLWLPCALQSELRDVSFDARARSLETQVGFAVRG